MKLFARSLVLAGVMIATLQVQAACTLVPATPATFGAVSSILVNTTVQATSTVNGGLRCSGSLLSLLSSTDHFYLRVTSAQTGLQATAGGEVIRYTLYGDNTTGYPLTRGVEFDFARTNILDLLGLLGSSQPKAIPLYLRTLPGSNVPAGIYTETLTVNWRWDYCTGIGLLGICLGRNSGNESTSMTVTLTVTNDCQITAPNLSFGSAPLVLGFPTVSQTLSLACTKGSSYTVGLSDGAQPVGSGGRRRMLGNGQYLAYDIFKGSSGERWGSTGSARRSSTDAEVNPGAGTGIGSQVFNYNARIYTDQPTPGVGAYVDNVILDVAF